MRPPGRQQPAADQNLRRIGAALIDVTMPSGVDATAIVRLRVPLGIAVGASVLAAVLVVVALVDLARLVVGPGAVALALATAVLVLPAAKLLLGVPSGPMAAIARAAPLLRAIDLGAGLPAAWRVAALVSPIGPAAVIGLAATAVLTVRGSTGLGVGIAAATATGAAAGWLATGLSVRTLQRRRVQQASLWRASAQSILAVAIALGAAAAAPMIDEGMRGALGTVALAVVLAVSVHLAGELLGLDARGALRLARSLVDCGAPRWRLLTIAAAGMLLWSGGLGAAAATAVGALSGAAPVAALAGIGAAHTIVSAIAVLVARPDAADVVPRVLLFAVALVPAGLGLAAGSWGALGAATALAVAAVVCIVASRLS